MAEKHNVRRMAVLAFVGIAAISTGCNEPRQANGRQIVDCFTENKKTGEITFPILPAKTFTIGGTVNPEYNGLDIIVESNGNFIISNPARVITDNTGKDYPQQDYDVVTNGNRLRYLEGNVLYEVSSSVTDKTTVDIDVKATCSN